MRSMFWLRMTSVLVVATAALWAGCTEDDPVETDQTPPRVRLLNPDVGQGINISPIEVLDSILIVVDAQDDSGIERVEFWVTFHEDSTSRKLGESTVPVTPAPGEAQPGSGQHEFWWKNIQASSGDTGVLWALAYDRLGNSGRASNPAPVRYIGSGDRRPPIAAFTIDPNSGGRVSTNFEFDPGLTTDDIDPLSSIRVRWAFDYKEGFPIVWDVDTTEARASEPQFHQYSQPRTYTIALQAFNTYVAEGSAIVLLDLTVAPEGGEPHPPAPTVMIPAGTYPLGVTSTRKAMYSENELVERDSLGDDGNTYRVPAALFVAISANLYIDRYEVSNARYVEFLNRALLDSAAVAVNEATGEVTEVASGNPLITLDPTMTRIIYVDQEAGFSVDANSLQLPVTGVTWFGAKAYCSFYGLRLPTEYEWEIAARLDRRITSADQSYVYPWTPDTQINGAYANYRDSGDPYEATSNLRAETPIASYSNIEELMGSWPHENAGGPVGTYDQAGNVSEWVDNWYVERVYDTLRQTFDQQNRWPVDPQSPRESESPTHTRVIRGGSFFDTPTYLRVTRREARDPAVGSATVGFRAIYTEFNP